MDLTQPLGGGTPVDTAGEHPSAEDPDPAARDERASRPPTVGQLRRERKRLWSERQETVFHVGGLAVELRRREMLDEGLVARRADTVLDMDARIVEIDAKLSGLDEQRRRGRTRTPDARGYCLSCGGPYLADAVFCSRCGARIHTPSDEGDTQVIPIPGQDGP